MTRVVVIGAGIVGTAAAHRLAAGGAQVTVFDNGAIGGATAAGAGIIATISSRVTDLDVASFRFAAARHYLELVETCTAAGISGHSYAPVGQLSIAFDDAEQAALEVDFDRATELVGRFGPSSVGTPELLTAAEVSRRYPMIAPTRGGLLLPEVARVDGDVMRRSLLQLAVAHRATVVTGTAHPEIHDGRVTAVSSEHGRFEADVVVVAAGAWSGTLIPSLAGIVEPQRGQIVHLHLPGASALPTLDTAAGHYLLTFPGDHVVIGATRETGSGFDAELTAGGVAQVLAQGMSLVPSLAQARWIEARVGLRPASRDGFPILGQAPGVDGLWLATGMGPSGLTLGPYCGSVVAQHVLADHSVPTQATDAEVRAPAIPRAYQPARS
ncbi:D-amino-acid dehydrogenase [Nakamurella sp. UYEF19]|uniref:NAD(P)/FAD-dependent oxidoreductase n=1 Tax=Nakamurella sp. UYEF19 TaxID=1756392 RepID=UPI003394413C